MTVFKIVYCYHYNPKKSNKTVNKLIVSDLNELQENFITS